MIDGNSGVTPGDRYMLERDRAERAIESMRASIKAHGEIGPTWDRVADLKQAAELLELIAGELKALR